MLIKTQFDVIYFLNKLNNVQLDDINIRYWHNTCYNIEKISINILRSVKDKYIEFKNLLKELRNQERILILKMNLESGIYNFNQEKSIEDIINKNTIMLNIHISDNPNKCIEILFQYTEKINKIYKNIININHILSLCNSIIFNVWKNYYSFNQSKEKIKEFEPFYNRFIGIFDSLINYNLFYSNL